MGVSKSPHSKVTNGVKQGGVLSPVLFTLYADVLLHSLQQSGYGCYIGNQFMGAFAYADDIVLLSPSRKGLAEMVAICEQFSLEYNIFNASKSKMIVLGKDDQGVKEIIMDGSPIPVVNTAKHLGNIISRDCGTEQVQMSVQDMYKKFNQFFAKFASSQSFPVSVTDE